MRISDWSSDVCSSDLKATYTGDAGIGDRTGFFLSLYGTKRRTFSQELRADGETGKFKWVAGLYYFRDKVPFAFIRAPNFVLAFGSVGSQNEYRQKTTSAAGFAQVDFELTPTVTLTGGARYSHEKKALTISDTLPAPSLDRKSTRRNSSD